jgi:hypothetical protein
MGHTSAVTTIVVLGLFWLFGPGLLAVILFGPRRKGKNRLPSRFEHLRATSTYLPTQLGQGARRPRKAPG